MAAKDIYHGALRSLCRANRQLHANPTSATCRRPYTSSSSSSSPRSTPSNAASDLADLDTSSALATSRDSISKESLAKSFDPVARSKARSKQLPSSRYKFRSPKYDSGPLHPHRPPRPSDPSSRLFVPGPFTLPRVQQTYETTIAPDLLTLCYLHHPPGFKPPPPAPRLRGWDDSSPYHVNRQLRGPRGGDVLRLLREPINIHNIPKLDCITVNAYVKSALYKGSAPLHVAGMALQAITNVKAAPHKSRSNVPQWGVVKDRRFVALTVDLKREDMMHFFAKLVDVVMPRIKDWQGIKGSSGDSSGNITFGLEPNMVALFPEIEVNYDMYPPEFIPGCHITLHTTAKADKDARLLLNSFGIPFHGKYVD